MPLPLPLLLVPLEPRRLFLHRLPLSYLLLAPPLPAPPLFCRPLGQACLVPLHASPVPGSKVVKRKAPRAPTSFPRVPQRSAQGRPPSVSPSPITARERHLTLRFTTLRSIALPQGCSAEAIHTPINAVFSSSAKIGGSHPYLKEARLRADIGCIFMILSEHSAQQVEGLLKKAHAVLMRDFALPDVFFTSDT